MSLNYSNTVPIVLIGSKTGTTRTSTALATSYGAVNKVIETGAYSTIILDVLYTTGAAETNNSVEIKIEDSTDRTNFYQLTNESASAGVSTITQREFTFVGASAATAYAFSLKLDIAYKYLKISAKESGVAANAGTVYIEGVLAGK
jgi:hypothetical protein